MKLSYFSYDFWECCCVAVNDGGWAGVFVVLLRLCFLCGAAGVPGAACCVRPGCSVRPPSTAHNLPGSVWSLCVPVGGGLPACCLWLHGCFGRRRPRPPARLGALTSFGAAPRSPPVPSGPSGALHTSGAGSLLSGSARCFGACPVPATAHGHRSLAHQSLRALARQALTPLTPARTPNFARNSPTTASSFELRSLELQRF